MKKLSIILLSLLIFNLPSASVFAINFCLDFLEPGNPGGRTTGLMTCDNVNPVAIVPGSTFALDIWLNAAPGNLFTTGFFMEYNPSKFSIINRQVYSGFYVITNQPDYLGPGTYFLFLSGGAGANVILVKLTFQCIACYAKSNITFLPSFDEGFHVTVGIDRFVYDPLIDTEIITIGTCDDFDDDGICDEEDNCPNNYNPGQEDVDLDTIGNACDQCPNDFNNDIDNDNVCGDVDNCPQTPNGSNGGTCTEGDTDKVARPCGNDIDCGTNGFCSKNQEDTSPPEGDGVGDACSFCEPDFLCDRDVDGSDASLFKTDYGRSMYKNPCIDTATCHGDFDCDHDQDGTDAAFFKSDFGRNPNHPYPCPVCQVGIWCAYP